jgi:hypothetical protein
MEMLFLLSLGTAWFLCEAARFSGSVRQEHSAETGHDRAARRLHNWYLSPANSPETTASLDLANLARNTMGAIAPLPKEAIPRGSSVESAMPSDVQRMEKEIAI